MPFGPLCGLQRRIFREVRERLLNGRTPVRTWRQRWSIGAPGRALESDIFSRRKKSDVHIDQEFPLIGSAAPGKRLSQSVAGVASVNDLFVGKFFVDHTIFGH